MSAKRIDIGRYPGDFWEHTLEAWADIDGKHWQMRRASETAEPDIPAEQLYNWLAEGAQRLTDRQRLFIDAYYNRGLSMEFIAQELGVDRSSVSRVIQRGMTRMRDWLEAKKLIALHTDQQGNYDWIHILEQLPGSLLPRRQRQLLIMKISNPTGRDKGLADTLGLGKSSVSKTLKKSYSKLQDLGMSDLPFYPGCNVKWAQLLEEAGVLTDRQRQVVLMKLSNPQFSHKEIGMALGITQNSVTSALFRAKCRIQRFDELEGVPTIAIIKILNRRCNFYEFVRN